MKTPTRTAAALAGVLLALPAVLASGGTGAMFVPRAPDPDNALAIADQGNRALLEIRRDATRLAPPALPRHAMEARK
ncbi:MAG TPA: hypothetical protein VM369_10235 [Candidatus Binatia bacterium]|nr:hypothetical protein [Candidatus Binatia bacterium]